MPVLQCDNEVQALFDSNTPDPENLCYIDNSNSAHFHVIAGELGRRGHELASFQHGNPADIISHQAVATFDQPKHALAFPDPARPANQNADAQNIHHAAEFSDRWRKIHLQSDRGGINELHRDHRRAEHGDLCLRCDLQQLRREMKTARHHQTRNLARA